MCKIRFTQMLQMSNVRYYRIQNFFVFNIINIKFGAGFFNDFINFWVMNM